MNNADQDSPCTCYTRKVVPDEDIQDSQHWFNCPVYEPPLTYNEIRQLRGLLALERILEGNGARPTLTEAATLFAKRA